MITKAAAFMTGAGVVLGTLALTLPAKAQIALEGTCAYRAAASTSTSGRSNDAGAASAPLYIDGPTDAEGTNGGQAVVQAMAFALGASAQLVYVASPSCTALANLVGGTTGPAAATLYTSTKVLPCTASGAVPDLAISDVDGDTCTPGLVTAAQADFLGPVEVATFAAPIASTEQSISADAAYVIFGFGGVGYGVKPWTDANSIFAPGTSSGPENMVAAAIGLATAKWANPLATLTPLTAESKAISGGKASASIGILPAQTVAASPTALKTLAYQHTGQTCGYFPDSDPIHLDRINVRQGRYALWGPLHFVTNVDAFGNPIDHLGRSNPMLNAVIEVLAATGPTPDFAPNIETGDAGTNAATPAAKLGVVLAEATAGLVPWCAMQVTRALALGDESPYSPPEPCGCAFESTVGASLSSIRCAVCASDNDCPVGAPNCRFGYCETQ